MLKTWTPKEIILFGIPILFTLAFVTHFIYEWVGEPLAVGLFFPVNESVYEHMKLFTVSTFLYFLVTYYFKKDTLNPNTWFTSALLSILVTIVLIPALHYLYTQSFGSESVLIDIAIALVAIGFGQLLALHFYEHGTGLDSKTAIILILVTIFTMAMLTLYPPKIPLFMDSTTGGYGIDG